jgi:arylsulfatase A-like enzyme
MKTYAAAARAAAIAGTVVGLGLGLLRGSATWPWLSFTNALRPAAVGWLIGLAASPLLGWAASRGALSGKQHGRSKARRFLGGALTAAAVAPVVLWPGMLAPKGRLSTGRAPNDARPNIIFITIDALRADHLGAYGSEDGLTPNLDAFAEEATRYDAAYVSSPWTFTSFGSIFSSLPPSGCGLKLATPGLHDWYLYSAKLPESVKLVHEALGEMGYVTAAELTNCFLTSERGWRRGFDYFRNEDGPELGAILTRANTVTENALSWLRVNEREPFFLWVHYLDPHVPYNSPDTPREVREKYPGDWLTRREYWYRTMIRADEETKGRYRDFCRDMYREEVRFADRWVGKLLAGIGQSGLWDDSLIVISADHGEELFDHGGFEHGHTLYEELLWVPLLVKWPGADEASEVIEELVALADLPATFLAAADAAHTGEFRGSPLPRKAGGDEREAYSEGMFWGVERVALTTPEYKIIYQPYGYGSRPRFEVYDRQGDRAEQDDVADSEAADELRKRLVRLATESEAAAKEWKHPGKQEFHGIDLSDATREKLRALGYIGD